MNSGIKTEKHGLIEPRVGMVGKMDSHAHTNDFLTISCVCSDGFLEFEETGNKAQSKYFTLWHTPFQLGDETQTLEEAWDGDLCYEWQDNTPWRNSGIEKELLRRGVLRHKNRALRDHSQWLNDKEGV